MRTGQELKNRRIERLIYRMGLYKEELAGRLDETHKLFAHKVFAVDIHTHSNYSDGGGTVEENYACMKKAGLDFLFVTDHSSLGQKRVVRKWSNASWGQEPIPRDAMGQHFMHHIGLLCGRRRFRPRADSVAADFERAGKIAPFVWVPHPAGWGKMLYPQSYIDALWTLGDSFAMEVLNGAHNLVRAYGAPDRKAVNVWDRLLCDGKQVTALGGSDAHLPDEIGTVWTGVFASRPIDTSIIKTLNCGHCFASEASLLDFSCQQQPMGSTIKKKPGETIKLNFRVVDSAGIASVRIIGAGKVMKQIRANDQSVVDGSWTTKVSAKTLYYRLESTASDDRRAFSTPIYVHVAKTRRA